MALVSQNYMSVPEDPEIASETGWPDVRKGILQMLLGYLICIFFVGMLVALVFYVTVVAPSKPAKNQVTTGEVLSILGLGAFALGQLYSVVLLVRGQWTCLVRSPERCHAKWLMFASILFVLMAPTCGFFSGFLVIGAPRERAIKDDDDNDSEQFTGMVRGLEKYKDRDHLRTLSGLLQLTSHALSMMSSVLFILYLRAVARCWESDVCVGLIDIYLFFLGALVVAAVALPFLGPQVLAQMVVLLGLGVGAVIAVLWYLLLLFLVSNCIAAGLANRQSVLA
jgi:hypothetical protein